MPSERPDDPVGPQPQGTWPQDCVQRAFVAGAVWWLWQTTGATPWPQERDAAEQEAVRRYGEPGKAEARE